MPWGGGGRSANKGVGDPGCSQDGRRGQVDIAVGVCTLGRVSEGASLGRVFEDHSILDSNQIKILALFRQRRPGIWGLSRYLRIRNL